MDTQEKKRGRPKLKTVQQVRVFVSKALRDLREGNMDDQGRVTDMNVARVLIYGAGVLGKLIRDQELEVRLQALEKRTMKPEPVTPRVQ